MTNQSVDQVWQNEQRVNTWRYETEFVEAEDWDVDVRSERLLYKPKTQEPKTYQEVKFGAAIFNVYGNGRIGVYTKILNFDGCYTFGYEDSKFNGGKGSMSLCLTDDQLSEFKHIVRCCESELQKAGYGDYVFKTGLYKDKIYIKVESFLSERVKKNTKVNAKVDVKSIYITDKRVAHLQLYLTSIS